MHLQCATHALAPLGSLSAQMPSAGGSEPLVRQDTAFRAPRFVERHVPVCVCVCVCVCVGVRERVCVCLCVCVCVCEDVVMVHQPVHLQPLTPARRGLGLRVEGVVCVCVCVCLCVCVCVRLSLSLALCVCVCFYSAALHRSSPASFTIYGAYPDCKQKVTSGANNQG